MHKEIELRIHGSVRTLKAAGVGISSKPGDQANTLLRLPDPNPLTAGIGVTHLKGTWKPEHKRKLRDQHVGWGHIFKCQ